MVTEDQYSHTDAGGRYTLQVATSSPYWEWPMGTGEGLPEGLTMVCLCLLGSPLGTFSPWIGYEEKEGDT